MKPSIVEIIAEVGSNHNGNIGMARRYVAEAKRCGADMVKFQSIRKDRLWASKIWCNGELITNPVLDIVKNLDFPEPWHAALQSYADEVGIEFLSTPFYLEVVDLMEAVGVKRYKISSGDITFFTLLEKVGQTGKPVFLSTGASDLREVGMAVEVMTKSGTKELTLLHCVSNYPPAWEEMNLRSLVTLHSEFGLPVGLSDHTPGNMTAVMAVALGAVVIEKHVTFDRSLPGPDHPYAMTMEELADFVQVIRNAELALGSGEKIPSATEMAKQLRMRRGLYHSDTGEPFDGPGSVWLRPQY